MTDKKSVVIAAIPAFNEEKTIGKVILLAWRQVDGVIVCDDGSKDMTAEMAEKLGAKVVRHERNLGKGAALRTLFEKAREVDADVLATLDADGQHDPGEIPRLVRPILDGEADVVVGSRFMHRENQMPRYRRFGSRVLNFFTNAAAGNKVADTQSGFRAYSRKAVQKIKITEMGIGVDSQILMDAAGKGLMVVEVPTCCSYEGETSTYNPLRHALNVMVSIVRYVSEKRPLLVFGIPGTVTLGIGLLFFIQVLQTFFITRQLAIGTMLISMIAILAGVFAIFTAIILYTIANLLQKLK